jgi:hypothetical protein
VQEGAVVPPLLQFLLAQAANLSLRPYTRWYFQMGLKTDVTRGLHGWPNGNPEARDARCLLPALLPDDHGKSHCLLSALLPDDHGKSDDRGSRRTRIEDTRNHV